jgi:hypothetical protein
MSIYSDYGVSSSSKKRANQLQAAITRAQYDDYQTRFVPYLNKLTAQVSDEQVAADKSRWNNEFMNQAKNNPGLAMESSNRNLSRYGVSQDNRANKAGMGLAKANSTSSAIANMNATNQAIDDRVTQLLSGQQLKAKG